MSDVASKIEMALNKAELRKAQIQANNALVVLKDLLDKSPSQFNVGYIDTLESVELDLLDSALIIKKIVKKFFENQ